MRSLLHSFREFAFKGNAIDLAVGVIIGAAFGKIVTGIVEDMIMPIVGLLLPAGNWREAGLTIGHRANSSSNPAEVAAHPIIDIRIAYGHLLGVTIDFLIVAFVLFLAIRIISGLKKAKLDSTRHCPACLETIPKDARRCKFCTENLNPV